MKKKCPICYEALHNIECAPCWECGHLSEEIQCAKESKHTYKVYEIFEGVRIQLCNFCAIDTYLVLKNNHEITFSKLTFVQDVPNPVIEIDSYCENCQRRNKYLNFLMILNEITE